MYCLGKGEGDRIFRTERTQIAQLTDRHILSITCCRFRPSFHNDNALEFPFIFSIINYDLKCSVLKKTKVANCSIKKFRLFLRFIPFKKKSFLTKKKQSNFVKICRIRIFGLSQYIFLLESYLFISVIITIKSNLFLLSGDIFMTPDYDELMLQAGESLGFPSLLFAT